MAEPKTIAGIALSDIAVGASIAGTALSAVGAINTGVAARQQADFQSAVLRQQADRERLEADRREEDFRRQQSRLMATRRAMLGGSGVEPTEGSPLLVSEDLAGETEYQALKIRSGGETVATRLEQQAVLQRASGRSAQQAGFMRGGSLLLTGAGATFGRRGLPLTV